MFDLKDLGVTNEELQERVVQAAVRKLLYRTTAGDNDDTHEIDNNFKNKLETIIKEKIDTSLETLCDKHILPNTEKFLMELTFKSTNKYGEKTKEPKTLIEYLAHRCQTYMNQPVNYEGKPQANASSYNWKQVSTRLVYLIDKFLHHKIETEMKTAVGNINKSIENGLAQAVKIAISDITKNLKVITKTK